MSAHSLAELQDVAAERLARVQALAVRRAQASGDERARLTRELDLAQQAATAAQAAAAAAQARAERERAA